MIDINMVITSVEFTAATRSKQRTKKRTIKDRKKSIKRGRSKPGKRAAGREYKRSAKAGKKDKKKYPAKKVYSESQSFSRSKKEDKRKKVLSSIFISIVIGLVINALTTEKIVCKVLVDEDFSTDPNDWIEVGECATHDGINEWMTLNILAGGGDRYYKAFDSLDNSMNFRFHYDYEATVIETSGMMILVCFDTSTKDIKNMVGALIHGSNPDIYVCIYSSDGSEYVTKSSFTPNLNVQYRYDFEYTINNRMLTLDLYQDSSLKDSINVTLPAGKSFIFNAMGANECEYSHINVPVEGNYDNAYFVKL